MIDIAKSSYKSHAMVSFSEPYDTYKNGIKDMPQITPNDYFLNA